jgi:hypothetical protein
VDALELCSQVVFQIVPLLVTLCSGKERGQGDVLHWRNAIRSNSRLSGIVKSTHLNPFLPKFFDCNDGILNTGLVDGIELDED